MQTVTHYSRIVARAIAAGLHSEFQIKSPLDSQKPKDPLHLVSGISGYAKSVTKSSQVNKWTFGDDAYFVSRSKVADVLGVADGVGGWRNYGIDPSVFPCTLMQVCERLVREGHFVPQSPAKIIAASYSEMLEQKLPILGSSTACVVSLHREEKTIYSANLGDSGFLVVRNSEVVHRSADQQHYFNTPYQLALAPPMQEAQWLNDSPEMAESSSFKVQDGDILMLATDGLFDNMSEDMIVRTLSYLHSQKEEERIQHAAASIAQCAYQLSLDPDYMSPFAISACSLGLNLR
ncbi:unnamed protein product, partial [Candidula unifasciata]